MAALVRHGVLKTGQSFTPKNAFAVYYATKAEKKKGIDRKVGPKIDSSAQSLAAKGFLRAQSDYSPPRDLNDKLSNIFRDVLGTVEKSTILDDPNKRFDLLNACSNEFNRSVPNSMLHTIESLDDVRKFYETSVNTTTPLEKLKTLELPKNLHVQYEYHRFHPDTDTMFGGRTAFPRSSTLVTGLKYKNKYKGHVQTTTWPYTS